MKIRSLQTTAGALALTLHMGLSACVTADPPSDDRDDDDSRNVDERTDQTKKAATAKKKKKALARSDAGSDAMAESEPQPFGATNDGGAPQEPDDTGDAGMPRPMIDEEETDEEDSESDLNPGSKEQPHYYCGILGITIRVCNGSQDTSYSEGCVDDVTNCLAFLPPDERIDYSEYCYTRTEYEVFGGQAQVGTCAQYDAYWAGELECLKDSHCGTGERCVDNACACPEGADCICPNCGPQPARCDGDVFIESIGAGPCDENRECVYEERRTDCAAQNLTCDPSSGCVEPSTPPPPPPSNPGTPGVPGTPGGPDGGV